MSEQSDTPSIHNSEETTRISSPPPPSSQQQTQNEKDRPAVEKSETEVSKAQGPIISTTNDGKTRLQVPQNQQDFVVQIANNDPNREELDDLILDQPTNNSTRKLSSVEEDVCYPIRPDKKAGIDYEALEEYIAEEKIFAKSDEGLNRLSPFISPFASPIISPVDSEPKKSSLSRRVSEFGERIKNPIEVKEEFRFIFYSVATGTIKAKSLASIPPKGKTMTELLKQGVFWIDVLAPTESEIRILSRIFHIHPLTMEDIETEETREKCETFKNYYFVCFRSHNNDQDVEPISMYSVVMREGLLTFHFQPTPHPQNVRRRIQYLKDYITVTPDWINYAIMDDITDYFAPLIHKVEFESDAIDQLVMVLKKSEQQDMLIRIGLCRKMVMTLLKMLGTKADVIKGLIKRFEDKVLVSDSDKTSHEVSLYLGDIQDHILTMLQNLNHYENLLSRAHSNYLAQISIEITQLSNATNDVLNRMTVFATVLLPMNVVTGLFGMNVRIPGQEGPDLGWFGGITLSFVAIGVIGYFTAKRVGLV